MPTAEEFINQTYATDFDYSLLRVWNFHQAPEALRQISENRKNGEEWLMLVPPAYPNEIDWATGLQFGVRAISSYPLENGWKVVIGESRV